jgi:heme/copper-type cytochrome/quinol oxidase subunit 3
LALQPGLIFAIVVGAALLLTIGTGFAIAAGLYGADRAMRSARVHPAGPYITSPAPDFTPTPTVASRLPSALSQVVASRGQIDAAPSLGLGNTKLGMWVFLASEVIFFSALIGAFLYFRGQGVITRVDTHQLNIPVTAVNTFLLLTSSFAVVTGFDALLDGKRNRFMLMLFATWLLGAVFVSIQGIEWSALFREGISPSTSTFGTAFFVMTGFHGTHVIVGLLWLLLVIAKAIRGDFSAQNYTGYEVFGLYWHFVDVVWIVLFTIIYLI